MIKNFKNSKIHIDTKYMCIVFFAVYIIITIIGVFNHEYSYDESQAWCLARDNDIAGVFNALKYEGHPPLWYLIIYPFARSGCPISVLSFISWIFCAVSAWIVMFKSPFKPLVKTAIIFSSGFIYQNSINARNYCLIVLLLCLLAMIYPKRTKHPLIFGLLTGLMANTHVIMAGLVGIIGIYMIIDFFKNFKSSSKKNNIMQIAGMLIALAGVVLLVVPLMNSISSNQHVSGYSFSLNSVLFRLSKISYCIGVNLFQFSNGSVLSVIIAGIVTFLFLTGMFILRRYPRALIAFIVFSVFFFFSTQIIYSKMLPSRASICLYTFICILWGAKNSSAPGQCDIKLDYNKMDSELIKRIAQKLIDIDSNYSKTLNTIICLVSLPSGLYLLARDISSDTTAVKPLVNYIRNNLSLKDNIILLDNIDPAISQFTAEYPELKIYSIEYNGFLTYNPYSSDSYHSFSESREIIKKYKHIYFLSKIDYTFKSDNVKLLFHNDRPNDFFIEFTETAVLYEIDQETLDTMYSSVTLDP